MAAKTITCPSCGFKNPSPLQNQRCVSCGAKVEEDQEQKQSKLSRQEELEKRYRQEGFSPAWFGIALVIIGVLTVAVEVGLPMVLPFLDFEGSSGMLVAITVWCLGGCLVGLISPGRTFVEPVVAVFLLALPTAFWLYTGQTVKTMPAFMYVLMSILGLLFTLVGAYVGELIQMGPAPKTRD